MKKVRITYIFYIFLNIIIFSSVSTNAEESSPIQSHFNGFAPLVKKVKPGVVKIVSEAILKKGSSFFGEEFFDNFYNVPHQKKRISGIGSGFFISSDGYIVTNYHVIKDSLKVIVIDVQGKKYDAKKVGEDPQTDLALLKVEGKKFPYIPLGDSNASEVGDLVLAIGNPLNQDLTVTSGIVSAKGRKLVGLDIDYQNFIQTDAAINHGNSGGPLINMKGEAIGINTIILTPTGGSIGLGFAIPSNMAQNVIKDLKNGGKVSRGYIGLDIIDIDDKDAKEFKLPHGGILIWTVENDAPAFKAGLKKYDLIIKINDETVKSKSQLKTVFSSMRVGDKIKLTIYRGKEIKTIYLIVENPQEQDKVDKMKAGDSVNDLGMELKTNNSQIAEKYGLRIAQGIVVVDVKWDSLAHKNEIQAWDVILEVNQVKINCVEQFNSIIAEKKSGSRLIISINRDGEDKLIRLDF
jgi:serine protease Do